MRSARHLRHLRAVRPEYRKHETTSGCSPIISAELPERPIPRSIAGPGVIAHVITQIRSTRSRPALAARGPRAPVGPGRRPSARLAITKRFGGYAKAAKGCAPTLETIHDDALVHGIIASVRGREFCSARDSGTGEPFGRCNVSAASAAAEALGSLLGITREHARRAQVTHLW